MAIPDLLKFDVRVRDRLLSNGLITETEVSQHLEALQDLQAQTVDLTVKQPALQAESDRDIVIVRASGTRPPVAPIRPIEDELDMPIPDDDLDDDEDDDDDEDTKAAEREKIAVAEKKKAAEAAPATPEAEPEKAAEKEEEETEAAAEEDAEALP